MGMTRRLNYYENPVWNNWLLVAGVGAIIVLCGILIQFYQIFASIRDHKKNADLTGDPWDARTLEWTTSSPPPFYNFAKLPEVRDRDHFYDLKKFGLAHKRPEKYTPIHMPKNTWAGIVISGFSLVMGFAMVWHIWWMAIMGTLGMIVCWVAYAFDKNKDYYVQVNEVEAIENKHFDNIERAKQKKIVTSVDDNKVNLVDDNMAISL
jgi:cytochrome o ubiquinol oxidase subunit 1